MLSPEYHIGNLAAAAKDIPSDKPIIMLNLLRFNNQAAYPASSPHSSCTGREAYLTRYREAFQSVAASLGITATPIYVGVVHGSLLAGKNVSEKFDMMALVKYEDFGDLRRILESEEYVSVAQVHHHAALESWRFYATTEVGV